MRRRKNKQNKTNKQRRSKQKVPLLYYWTRQEINNTYEIYTHWTGFPTFALALLFRVFALISFTGFHLISNSVRNIFWMYFNTPLSPVLQCRKFTLTLIPYTIPCFRSYVMTNLHAFPLPKVLCFSSQQSLKMPLLQSLHWNPFLILLRFPTNFRSKDFFFTTFSTSILVVSAP